MKREGWRPEVPSQGGNHRVTGPLWGASLLLLPEACGSTFSLNSLW